MPQMKPACRAATPESTSKRLMSPVVADNAWQKAQSYLTEQLSATRSLIHHLKSLHSIS